MQTLEFGKPIETVSKRTIYRMVGELVFFADYLTVNAVLKAENATIVFDATTQDGMHINCILLTTPDSAHLVSLKHLAGGTAVDYKQHICCSIRQLANVYSLITGHCVDELLQKLISKINCSLTDRAPVNHATCYLLEKAWDKRLVELNCNIHPLEAVSRATRKALTNCESPCIKEMLHGDECLAWKLMLGLNSLRYSDRKGNVRAFKVFLQELGLKMSLIPRFRGNRIHIIFQLGATYFLYYENLKSFLQGLTNKNQDKKNLQKAFQEETAAVEFQILGVIGKLLTGPWMHTFYTSNDRKHPMSLNMTLIKEVIYKLEVQVQDPYSILFRTHDFFGHSLLEKENINKIMMTPTNIILFSKMMKASLSEIVCVLKRQYKNSFTTVAGSLDTVMSSARDHTMLVESYIGEFCERKHLARNSYVSSICDLMKAKHNVVAEFVNGIDASILKVAIPYSRQVLDFYQLQREKTNSEIARRISEKRSKEEAATRKKMQSKLRGLKEFSFANLKENFPDIPDEMLMDLQGILQGTPISKSISHLWEINGQIQRFTGEITSFENNVYEICYFPIPEDELQLSIYEFGADLLLKDLWFLDR